MYETVKKHLRRENIKKSYNKYQENLCDMQIIQKRKVTI